MSAGLHDARVLECSQRLWIEAIIHRAPPAVIRGAALEFRAFVEDVCRQADDELVAVRRIRSTSPEREDEDQ
jgi:hypothetical protein